MKHQTKPWRGKNHSMQNPAVFIAEADFFFGGRLVVKDSLVKQFETTNFGFTSWTTPNGSKHLAKE